MSRGGIGGALLILLLATSAVGYTLLDLGMGSQVFQGSAKSGGMGEVFQLTESTPLSLTLNPSLIARSDKLAAYGSYRFMMVEENWSLPVHDSFDALLGYETYAHNRNVYHDGDLSFSTGALPQAAGLAFAIGYVPAFDFNYEFHEEVRDRNSQAEPLDKLIADAFLESEGMIRSVSLGGAGGYGERFFLGLGVDYLFGDYDVTVRLANMDANKLPCWEAAPRETAEVFSASDLSGARFRVGATYVVNKRVELAATYTGSAELDGEYSSSGGFGAYSPWGDGDGKSFKLKYPASAGFGISYRPRNELRTVVEADVRFTQWSKAENQALEELVLDDIYEWFIGVEHIFYNGHPLRFGFNYRPSPADKEAAQAAVTAGSGFDLYGLDLDFSLSIGWRKFREFSLFDDSVFCAQSREFSDMVEETLVGGQISLGKRF
jgi:hypothetical protein